MNKDADDADKKQLYPMIQNWVQNKTRQKIFEWFSNDFKRFLKDFQKIFKWFSKYSLTIFQRLCKDFQNIYIISKRFSKDCPKIANNLPIKPYPNHYITIWYQIKTEQTKTV